MVLENQPAGTFVLQVQAQDADTGVNGEVKYSIMHRDGISSGFHIDPDSGEFFIDFPPPSSSYVFIILIILLYILYMILLALPDVSQVSSPQ